MNPLLQTKGKRPRTGAVRNCERCKQEFYCQPCQVSRRRYCSRSCKVQGQLTTKVLTCEQCGVEYEKNKKSMARFCTARCYFRSRKPDKACVRCGKPVPLTARHYCSRRCFLDSRVKGQEGPCEHCGTAMWVQPHQATKRFCSIACGNEGKKISGPGCKYKRPDGYVAVYYPKHPDATSQGMILEHRLVAEQKYGRRILKTEQVHHLNHQRDDNRPENLEVISPSDHQRISSARGKSLRQQMKAELEEYKRRYGAL